MLAAEFRRHPADRHPSSGAAGLEEAANGGCGACGARGVGRVQGSVARNSDIWGADYHRRIPGRGAKRKIRRPTEGVSCRQTLHTGELTMKRAIPSGRLRPASNTGPAAGQLQLVLLVAASSLGAAPATGPPTRTWRNRNRSARYPQAGLILDVGGVEDNPPPAPASIRLLTPPRSSGIHGPHRCSTHDTAGLTRHGLEASWSRAGCSSGPSCSRGSGSAENLGNTLRRRRSRSGGGHPSCQRPVLQTFGGGHPRQAGGPLHWDQPSGMAWHGGPPLPARSVPFVILEPFLPAVSSAQQAAGDHTYIRIFQFGCVGRSIPQLVQRRPLPCRQPDQELDRDYAAYLDSQKDIKAAFAELCGGGTSRPGADIRFRDGQFCQYPAAAVADESAGQ